MTTNHNNIIEQLAVQYCPIVYFYKDEPYMPANFADMIKISELYDKDESTSADPHRRPKFKKLTNPHPTPQDLTQNSLISIKKNMVRKIPVGHEIICRTKGIYKLLNDTDTFIDLLYIVYFAYNGTLSPHVYDQEFVIVRLFTDGDINDLSKWNMLKGFGSIHGGGLWHDTVNIDTEVVDGVKRSVFYAGNESHAMYHKPGIYKRIFRFADDKTGKHKRWVPTKLIFMVDTRGSPYTNIYDYTTKSFNYNPVTDKYYRYSGMIGSIKEKTNQAWAGSNIYIYSPYYYDTVNTLPYAKYEGGVSNMFVGTDQQVSKTVRYGVYWSCITLWIIVTLLALYLFYRMYKPSLKSKKSIAIFSVLSLLIIIGFVLYFIVCFYVGLNLFIINDNYYKETNVPHLIMVDDEDQDKVN